MSQQFVVRFLLEYSHCLDVVCNTQSEAEALVRNPQKAGKDAAGRQWHIQGNILATFSMPLQTQQQAPQNPSQTQVRSVGYPPYGSGF